MINYFILIKCKLASACSAKNCTQMDLFIWFSRGHFIASTLNHKTFFMRKTSMTYWKIKIQKLLLLIKIKQHLMSSLKSWEGSLTFNKRFYRFFESDERIPALLEYYKFHINIPRNFHCKIINKRMEKNREI